MIRPDYSWSESAENYCQLSVITRHLQSALCGQLSFKTHVTATQLRLMKRTLARCLLGHLDSICQLLLKDAVIMLRSCISRMKNNSISERQCNIINYEDIKESYQKHRAWYIKSRPRDSASFTKSSGIEIKRIVSVQKTRNNSVQVSSLCLKCTAWTLPAAQSSIQGRSVMHDDRGNLH